VWPRLIATILVGIATMVPIVIADYFFVRSGQDTSSVWFSPWLVGPLWALGPIGLFLVNCRFVRTDAPNRYLYAARWALGLGVIWFVIAFYVHMGFHFSFGGRI
jgi:hypothetical protein